MDNEKTIKSSSDRLEMVIKELGENFKSFSKKLEYETPGSIYSIKYGRYNISTSFAKRVIKYFPEVNYLFLVDGTLPVLNSNVNSIAQSNMFIGEDITLEKLIVKMEVIAKTQIKILNKLEKIEKSIENKNS